MRLEKIDLEETHCFSGMFSDYLRGNESLRPFYENLPHIGGFECQIRQKSFGGKRRKILVETLKRQYQSFEFTDAVSENINLLKEENTYTITTGHQLNIFTGPLYFIYKIVSVINICKRLRKEYPLHNFVPVYWMASEDHDFEEINHLNLGGKQYTWQTYQRGAVGRFDPSSIGELLKEMPGEYPLFEKAYLFHGTLAEATRYYVNELFGVGEGLVVMDADDWALKTQLIPVIEDDLFVHSAEKLVDRDGESIRSLGYKTRLYSREINFFYLEQGIRARFEREEDDYRVVGTDITFSTDDIREMIKNSPKKFSPNVILRPLYQEMILPNLAYVGGPSEVVYWLQLRGVFQHFNEVFPILMPRNFALIIDRLSYRRLQKCQRMPRELFLPEREVIRTMVGSQTTWDLSLTEELRSIAKIYGSAQSKAKKIDITLGQHLEALQKRTENLLRRAQGKMYRAQKRHYTDKIKQYRVAKSFLFPRGQLQERTANFLSFYSKNPEFIQELLQHFDPFDYRMNILIES